MSILPFSQPIENGLVPIYSTDDGFAVNTRELHAFLESGKDYSDWFKYRVNQYGLIEGRDFTTILGKSTGGRPTTDYIVPLDVAKELAMVENNEKGRQVRRYFIEAEKRAIHPKPMTLTEVVCEQAKIMVQFEREIKAQNERTTAIESKVDHITRVIEPIDDNWQGEIVHRIKSICREFDLEYEREYQLMYATLSTKGKNIELRQKNMKARLADSGATQKRIAAVSKIAVVASDPDLRAHFERIVQDWAIRVSRDYA